MIPRQVSRLPFLLLSLVLFVVAAAVGMGYFLTSNSTEMALLCLVGSFVFIFSFLNRIWALYFLVFAMMFSPEFQIAELQGAQVTTRIEDFLTLVIMVGWLANIAVDRNRALFRSSVLNVPILTYIQLFLIATLIGVVAGRVNFYKGFFFTMKYIQYFVMFFFVLNTALTHRQLRALVYLHLTASLFLAFFGISQIGVEARVSTPFEGTSEPATMGGLLVLVMSVALAYVIHSRNLTRRFLLAGLVAVMFPPFLYTLSRGSYVALVGAYGLLFLLSMRKPIMVFGMLAAGFACLVYMPGAVIERVITTFEGTPDTGYQLGSVIVDESTALRIRSYERTLERVKSSPLIGLGVRGAGFIDGEYPRVLAETGIAGLLCFGWLHLTILRYVYGLTKRLKSDFGRPLAVGFLAGHVGLLVHATGCSTFIIIRIMEPFWFLLALLFHFEAHDEEIHREETSPAGAALFDRRAWIAEQEARRPRLEPAPPRSPLRSSGGHE